MSGTIRNGGSLKRKMLVIGLEFLSKKLGENTRKLSLNFLFKEYDWDNLFIKIKHIKTIDGAK